MIVQRCDRLPWRVASGVLLAATADGRVIEAQGSAALVWQLLEEPVALEVLADELAEAFATDPAVVLADLQRLCADFEAMGLVVCS